MKPTNYLTALSVSIVLFMFGVGLLNYLVDPLQFFRLAGYPALLSKEQRYQAPGLVKNYSYQAIIVGTSLMDNISSEKVEQAIGLRTLNAAMNGSSIYEQHLLLSLALRSGRPKVVIWGVTPTSLVGEGASKVRSDLGTFPYWLYSTSAIEQALYIFNLSTTLDTIKIISTRYFKFPKYEHLSISSLNHFPAHWSFGRAQALAAFDIIDSQRPRTELTEQSGQLKIERDKVQAVQNCNNGLAYKSYMENLIQGYPEVKFHIVLPPVSILAYLAGAPPYNGVACADSIIAELLENKNVILHDFRSDETIITNLDNYMDTTHFSSGISDYMINSLHTKRYEISKSEATGTTDRLINLLNRYYYKKEEYLNGYRH